jgi:hypothetical protein
METQRRLSRILLEPLQIGALIVQSFCITLIVGLPQFKPPGIPTISLQEHQILPPPTGKPKDDGRGLAALGARNLDEPPLCLSRPLPLLHRFQNRLGIQGVSLLADKANEHSYRRTPEPPHGLHRQNGDAFAPLAKDRLISACIE